MNEFENIYHTYFKYVFLYLKSLSQSDDIASDNGLLYVTFDDNVSGYGISSYLSDDKNGYAYHILIFSTIYSVKGFQLPAIQQQKIFG